MNRLAVLGFPFRFDAKNLEISERLVGLDSFECQAEAASRGPKSAPLACLP